MRRKDPKNDFSEIDEINIQMQVKDGLTSGQQEIMTQTLMKNASSKPNA